jgi:Ca2+:H+ antiporter
MPTLSPQETRTQPNGPQGNTGVFVPRSTIRESQLYKRILGQSLKQAGLPPLAPDGTWEYNPLPAGSTNANGTQGQQPTPHVVPPRSSGNDSITSPSASVNIPSLTEEENQNLVRQVAEMAATAATVAARDAVRAPKKSTQTGHPHSALRRASTNIEHHQESIPHDQDAGQGQAGGGGHDAPNWSKTKSCIILVTATVAYAIIAEVLVNTVDVVLQNFDIDEKFLGITLFALVPNTTEFLVCRMSYCMLRF